MLAHASRDAIRLHDRKAAGTALAHLLERYREAAAVVLARAPGSVPVAAPVAHALGAPLDVLTFGALSLPGQTDVSGRTVLLVDEGMVTGVSMWAAVTAVRRLGAREVVVAVPVATADSLRRLRRLSCQVVAVIEPAGVASVAAYYDDFHQVADAEALALLARAALTAHG